MKLKRGKMKIIENDIREFFIGKVFGTFEPYGMVEPSNIFSINIKVDERLMSIKITIGLGSANLVDYTIKIDIDFTEFHGISLGNVIHYGTKHVQNGITYIMPDDWIE